MRSAGTIRRCRAGGPGTPIPVIQLGKELHVGPDPVKGAMAEANAGFPHRMETVLIATGISIRTCRKQPGNSYPANRAFVFRRNSSPAGVSI